jgi:FkbM family methyltransferase
MQVPQLTVLRGAGLSNILHRAVMPMLRMLPEAFGDTGCKLYLRALRLAGARVVARTYFGCRMACDPRDYVQSFILLFGTWEPDVSNALARSLAPGDVMIDVGSNVGYDALLGAVQVGETGRVIAIEASRRTFALLQANIALNGMESRILAMNVAASDRRGTLELFEVSETNIGAATTVTGRGGKQIDSVDALPLRDAVTAEDARRVRLIKMDVEGAELPILRDLTENLSAFPALRHVLVEASAGEDPEGWRDVFSRFRSAGFRAQMIPNDYSYRWYLRWRPTERLVELEEPPLAQVDILFTR